MTDIDTSKAQPAAPLPNPLAPQQHHGWVRRAYHRLHDFDHDSLMRRARLYDSHAYGLLVAIGLPLMGLLVESFDTKLKIACIWFALGPVLYFWLEGMEINAQVRKYGLLSQEESDYQRKTMYYLYVGAAIAFVVWVVGYAVYLALHWPHAGWLSNAKFVVTSAGHTSVRFGLIEWGLLVHTCVVGWFTIDVYYPLMSNFLQATAGQKRVEQETVTVVRKS